MIAELMVTSDLRSSWLDGLDGNGVELVKLLWNLCDYFVLLWPYFVTYLNTT
jgi:hypothetical protein